MIPFLGRTPFTFVGAISLFGLVDGFLDLSDHFESWMAAWDAFSRAIWDFLLGWLLEWFGLHLPEILKDYLTVGLISVGALGRLLIPVVGFKGLLDPKILRIAGIFLIAWPFGIPAIMKNEDRETRYLFFESFIYALILIAANYAFLFSGA